MKEVMCQICLAPLAVCKTDKRMSAALQCAIAIHNTGMLQGSGSWSLQFETSDAIMLEMLLYQPCSTPKHLWC